MKKKWVSLLCIVFLMCTLLPNVAFAQSTSPSIWVCGIEVTSANAHDVLGSMDVGATVRYDFNTDTLILENANIKEACIVDNVYCGIFANYDLAIEIRGKNYIEVPAVTNPENTSTGIFAGGKITINGTLDDALYMMAGVKAAQAYGLNGEQVSINNTCVFIGCVPSSAYGNAIYTTPGGIILNNCILIGVVEASGEESIALCSDKGILMNRVVAELQCENAKAVAGMVASNGNVDVENSELTITTKNATDGNSGGIYTSKQLNIINSVVEMTNGNATESTLSALQAEENIAIKDSKIGVKNGATSAWGSNHGIFTSQGNILIERSEIDVTGGAGYYCSTLYTDQGNIDIADSKIMLKSGNAYEHSSNAVNFQNGLNVTNSTLMVTGGQSKNLLSSAIGGNGAIVFRNSDITAESVADALYSVGINNAAEILIENSTVRTKAGGNGEDSIAIQGKNISLAGSSHLNAEASNAKIYSLGISTVDGMLMVKDSAVVKAKAGEVSQPEGYAHAILLESTSNANAQALNISQKHQVLGAQESSYDGQLVALTQKDITVPVEVLPLNASTATTTPTTTAPATENTVVAQNRFEDVQPSDYFYQTVNWAVENKITSGTSATTFSPHATCTRAQTLTFLWNSVGRPEPQGTTQFFDVQPDAYYAKAVQWAKETGIAPGDYLNPDEPCTRAQIVTYLWRLHGAPTVVATGQTFTDVPQNAAYAGIVDWAVKNKITSGTSATTFSPDMICTRAQVVSFLHRSYTLQSAQ